MSATPTTARREAGSLMLGIAPSIAQATNCQKVYPAYIGFRIKDALKALVANGDPKLDEPIISAVGDMQTIGDCRYCVPVTDHNGTKYKITVEVLS